MSDERIQFQRGDVVVHPRRPEWGDGVVDQAATVRHAGKPGQRLIVRFKNHGRITIHTAVAPLVSKESVGIMNSTRTAPSNGQGWLETLAQQQTEHELHRLPEAMTDPFASLPRRFEATLSSYRFSTEARSLIDWAVAQTGLDDPLSKYTRQELELGFNRFARDRDLHLKDLIKQLRAGGQASLVADAQRRPVSPAAQAAIGRIMRTL